MDRRDVQKITTSGALLAAATGLACLCLIAVPPAWAEIKLDPGLWQKTETGSENGEPVAPQVTTDCMTPQDALDPVKALSALKDLSTLIGQRCETLQVHQDGNTVSVEFKCGDPKTMSIAISMRFNFADARHYTGRVRSSFVFKGRETSADKTIDAKWLAAECKKP
jgi:hypothetical protein